MPRVRPAVVVAAIVVGVAFHPAAGQPPAGARPCIVGDTTCIVAGRRDTAPRGPVTRVPIVVP